MAIKQENEIAAALTRIADALEMLAQKPAWVKTAEKVVETAQAVVKEAPKVAKKPTEADKQQPAPADKVDELVGKTVKIVGGDHKGKLGTVADKKKAWVYVKTDDDPQIAVRFMHLEVIGDETGAPPSNQDEKDEVEALNAIIESTESEGTETTEAEAEAVGPEPSDVPSDAGNFIIEAGKHAGKTLHGLYHESNLGSKTVKWMARSANDETQQQNAQAFLTSLGEGWDD